MSGLWRELPTGWQAVPLPTLPAGPHNLPDVAGVALVPFGHGPERGVALLVRPGVPARVNGQPVLGGLRVLGHRDEVLLGQTRFFYSAQTTPCVTPFLLAEGVREPQCPVCRGPIRPGSAAVLCPGCGRWYHQTGPAGEKAARECWTYAGSCRFCGHPTSLTGEGTWRPEMEEADAY